MTLYAKCMVMTDPSSGYSFKTDSDGHR